MLQNKRSSVLMTEGDPKKVILTFAAPIFLSQLFQQLYNTADAWIVSRFLGDDAFAAVSSSGSLIFLTISFFVGASMGAGVVISRYFGAGDMEKVSRAVHTNVVLSFLCGLAMTVFGVLMTPTLLRWIHVDEAVLPLSTVYFRYYFSGALAMIMYNSLKGIMNAVGDSRRPLYYLIFSSLLNIFLDWLFVGVLGGGVEWAAIATAMSQGASALLCLRQLTRKGTVYRLSFRKLRIHWEILKEILRYGLPTAVQNSVIAFANLLVQSNVNTFGEVGMASWGAYSKIEGFAFLPITSFSMALSTFIGQNLGAGEHARARRGARFGLITSLLIAELIGLVIFLCAGPFIRFFLSGGEAIAWGIEHCRTVSLFYFVLAYSNCIAGVLRGAGKALVSMIVMLAVWCLLRIVYITVAMRIDHNIVLLYWAYPITWMISSVIYLIYYNKSDWVHGFEKRKEKTAEAEV
ncbi:MAG: MATE family efflux transporter [Lachnospiraceae bacterium]|nr:MATE family efflux transporter [Lachnospiraceae bacterium]